MRFVSFNANGIRARLHQLESITKKHQPDVIAVQETKVADEQFPLDDLRALGYPHIDYYGQKGHYGVALLSRAPAQAVQLGFPWRDTDQQRRFIMGTYDVAGQPVTIVNGYFPQGESRDHPTKFPDKRNFYANIRRYLEATQFIILLAILAPASAQQAEKLTLELIDQLLEITDDPDQTFGF